MDALLATATTVLSQMLAAQPETPAKTQFAWQIAAGPAIGRATDVRGLVDGRLIVRAQSESWRREVVRGRPVLLERLRQLLGKDAVRDLTVESADPESAGRFRSRR